MQSVSSYMLFKKGYRLKIAESEQSEQLVPPQSTPVSSPF